MKLSRRLWSADVMPGFIATSWLARSQEFFAFCVLREKRKSFYAISVFIRYSSGMDSMLL